MNKKMIAVMLAAVMVTAAGCGGSSDDSSADANLGVDEVLGTGADEQFPDSSVTSLGEYIGVEVEAYDTTVTDEELQEEIDTLLSYYTESVETDKTTVEDGDVVNIDYVGAQDGVEFDGGSYEGYELEIGSDTFIDGFEDGLIGVEVGSTVDLNLTFPDDYYSEDLAGAEVVFTVTVNYIVEYETPEWDDDFVSENLGYDTAAEYEEILLEELQEEKEEEAASNKEYYAILAVIEASEFEIGEDDLQTIIDTQTSTYETYASYYDVDLEYFVTYYMGMEMEEFESEIEELADFQLKCQLVVEAIAIAEEIQVTEEEYEEGLQELADYYGEDADEFEEYYGSTVIIQSLIYDKTIDFVADNAVEV